MYNGQVLRKLIAEAGLTKKQFEEQVFQGKSTGLYHVETATSVTCNTLERMRDVLKCSMDDFFTTPEWATKKTGEVIGSNNVLSNVRINNSKMETQYLKELIQEKDKRINTLENYIKLLESKDKKD
ncbi:helix-turn-helix transcriptional regulator [Segatella copri]|jgi:predicted transcriptional regulator|uniref:XRE family transcriptional regulator n=1 Tax=Segatella copri TaxID=165179 RepID=A0AA92V0Q9_9BACT|nr:helix-turn-helix transcriptional regulator [Segatella copri]DAI39013.1 MAG TPA: helix-turn-helix domain protein [Caudoviricetes sp.]RHA84736.1 XRE family transcriptional regulator [Segatella copri]WOF98217.1 helix-turn-helix transcriptional regulator [Segatella copri]WOG04576.1 helix-turn-helix transcriptional regulator [Segatella copri]DAX28864.1 MAG TPA: helix-turn-helix domain protein [Caudoviricetes sp.]